VLGQEVVSYNDTLTFASAVANQLAALRSDDHLLANVDSLTNQNDTVRAHLYRGNTYQYGDITIAKKDESLIGSMGLGRYRWRQQKVSESQLGLYMEQALTYLENHGYPFAKVQLQDVHIDEGTIDANLLIERGPLVVFDSIIVNGSMDVRPTYLRKYLLINKGEPYSRAKYEAIEKRLSELPFMKLKGQPKLRFYDGKAEIYIEADKARSSRFDFLIGVLPSTMAGQQQFTITGEFTAELYNRLGQGEYLYASFERVRPEVQELETKVRYPYIAGLPVGVAGALKIYRRSAQFLEVESELGADFQLSGNTQLLTSWSLKSSRLIDVDTAAILSRGRLPDNLDVVYQGGSLGLEVTDLDYRWNPRKGYRLLLSSKVGQKSILKNNVITGISNAAVDFDSSYDTLALRSLQLSGTVDMAYYHPLAEIITLQTRARGSFIYNPNDIYANEYYRIGGNRLLRGFDEQSVVAESYGLLTAEVRLLLDQNSYLTLPFVDYGYAKVIVDGLPQWQQLVGIGLGINFATPAGIFNVAFASGSGLGNTLNFNNTKVHFGYVSLF